MKQLYNIFNHTRLCFNRYWLVSAMLVLQFVAIKSTAQNRSNRGKEFWVGYGLHQFMEPGQANNQEMVLYLSAETAATVTVSYGPTYSKTYNIPANTVIATDLIQKAGTNDARLYSPPPGFGGTGGEGVFTNKAIHIVSNVPIVAYAHIYGSASSGATMLMPTDTWGYSYISCNSQQYYGNNCFSYMFVIAKENNTTIEITPSVPTRNGRTVGVPFTATLQKGEIYQVVGKLDPDNNSSKGFDLTGTTVKSIANPNGECFPVAVFSGSSRTSINCGGWGGSGDNALQQIFGYETWGKRYLTAPNAIDNDPTGKQNNIYRVVVKDPATIVKVNGNTLTGLQRNSYYEYNSSTGDYIEADKPVLVTQYMTSSGNCGNNMQWGDPEQVYISPIEQAIKSVGFYRNNKEDIRVNYLTLIIPTGGLTSLRIDGSNTFDHVYAHPNRPGYSIVVKRWGPTVGQSQASSDSAFVGTVYGMGPVESYAYNAGTLVNNLNAVGSIHNEYDNTKTTNDYTCTNTPVELSILMAYQPTKMVWKLSELAGLITPATDVTVLNPVSTGTIMVKGIPYYKYTLPGTYMFNTKGEYDIPVLTTHPSIENCNNTERVGYTIIVKDMPDKKFSTEYSGCTLDTIYLRGDTMNVANKQHRWYWEYPGNVKDSGQTVKKLLPVGTNLVKLTAISGEGCVSDTTFGIGVVPKPVASFTSDVNALCAGGKVVFTDNSTFGGTKPIGQWYYDFGHGNPLKDSTGTPKTDSFPTAGIKVVKHVVKVSEACVSDTVSISITVNANPVAGFSFPAGCIASDGIVQFTGTPTVTDNSTFTTHAWSFGDPAATPANPNTAAIQSPAHTYGTAGNYTIKYAVTTDKGCTKDSVLSATFKFKPKLAYAALTAICENVKGTVKVDKGTVLNGVTGNGYYRGPGVDATGNMTPATAGPGTHTIWYVFTTTDGCADSISTTIVVNAKPAAAFTIADVCLGQPVNIYPQPDPNVVSWSWDFGNKTTATYTNGNRFTFNYTQDSTWKVALVTRSTQGCSSDTLIHPVTVHPLPVADFTLPTKVCMPEGTAVFTNKSTIKGAQALTYNWNFGEANGISTATDPTYHYKGYGPVNVSLTTTSAAGCVNTATKAFNAFFAQPVAGFKVTPDTLCQGSDNVFTDQSTDPTANILGWTWNFGDGTTSTEKNPVKKYAQPGEYGVQLQVASASGCASAPFNSTVMVYLQPVIDAGPSFVVPQGTLVQFRPTANDSVNLQFRWEPAGDFPNPNVFAPQITAMKDGEYTMTAIGKHNCTASDKMTVKVLKPVQPPTAFSPNGDGINDTWVIKNLDDYPGATVEVFNRYGARVFRSQGYGTPWNGHSNGGILPVGTYYYVIKLKNGFPPLTGYVTILK
ncbi:gliding motility-associated-like protein [Chitinophaga dinghuensis]|uniref:Gliding motility-associated-like protein n=1 Tax=Chitinophaga dinghuensis TaxID=1539050 RepID=A0A327VQI2_9BACT|nr:PKD domain-containing protein [Chitinophaga dinghuensis]RAJ77441.1 gliding motility-associated-like protein [Chitinophaga dinghuensis]